MVRVALQPERCRHVTRGPRKTLDSVLTDIDLLRILVQLLHALQKGEAGTDTQETMVAESCRQLRKTVCQLTVGEEIGLHSRVVGNIASDGLSEW